MRKIVVFLILVISMQVSAGEIGYLYGIHADTLNKLDVKLGVRMDLTSSELDYDVVSNILNPHFIYSDIEAGFEGQKLSIGVGTYDHHGSSRWGVSYANLDDRELAGIEMIGSYGPFQLKLGAYSGLNGAHNHVLVGIGLGN